MANAGDVKVKVTLDAKVAQAIIERLDNMHLMLESLCQQCVINTEAITYLLSPEQVEALVKRHKPRQRNKCLTKEDWDRLKDKFLKHTEVVTETTEKKSD